ncbi:MAG: hypothetical protein OK439_06795, partial [Thaumarchaeota archaeon]|nr:hypothetical protein [Nitrososphaerota archaeon]
MSEDFWQYDTYFGQPISKDGCGVFGVLRKPGAPLISNTVAVDGISCIKYRGSDLGAGYACFESNNDKRLKIQAFVNDETIARLVTEKLAELLGEPVSSSIRVFDDSKGKSNVLTLEFDYSSLEDSDLEKKVDQINSSLLS